MDPCVEPADEPNNIDPERTEHAVGESRTAKNVAPPTWASSPTSTLELTLSILPAAPAAPWVQPLGTGAVGLGLLVVSRDSFSACPGGRTAARPSCGRDRPQQQAALLSPEPSTSLWPCAASLPGSRAKLPRGAVSRFLSRSLHASAAACPTGRAARHVGLRPATGPHDPSGRLRQPPAGAPRPVRCRPPALDAPAARRRLGCCQADVRAATP